MYVFMYAPLLCYTLPCAQMDDLPGMFGGLNFGSESGEEGLLSMMENMMGTLLSKEVLYPPLKEFCARVSVRALQL